MKYLFISEKPSTMRAIQDTYKKNKKQIDADIGELQFAALSGHVCRYIEPSEYKQWKDLKWKELDLPMIPDPFVIDVSKDKRVQGIVKGIKETLKSGDCDGIIVGTDSDTEGNGIFYLLSEYLKLQKYKTLRFFESDLTEKGIMDSLYKMTDFYTEPRDVRMTEQYKARSHFDWLVGMNATVSATLKTGNLMRIGRVKAPTLKLVYDNSKAIDEFVPHSDYQVQADFKDGFTGICYEDKENPYLFETPEKAEAFIKDLGDVSEAKVTDVSHKKENKRAPQLYKLSDLQVDAGSKYNYDPSKTLELVQSLYEKKFVSYPRTDGVYVSSEKAKSFPSLLSSAAALDSLAPYIDGITKSDIEAVGKNTKVVNDKEVAKSSHDALLPTEQKPDISSLSEDEKNIYELICRRLVAQFLPDEVDEKTVLWTDINGYAFKSTGSVVKEKGWSVLYDKKNNAEAIPQTIEKGDTEEIEKIETHEKKSTPPKRLATWSLVSAMENISKYIDDKDLKQTMKDAKGLGTQATRANIISELISSGYMEEKGKGKQLYITDKGKAYIEAIKDFSIIQPENAAEWETVFQQVREGARTYEEVEQASIDYINKFIKEVNALEITKEKSYAKTNIVDGVACPYCGKPIRTLKWGYACTDSPENCNFTVSNYNGKLKESDLKTLVKKGVTRKIPKVCESKKTGQSYDAKVKLNEKGSQYVTAFEFEK